MGRIIPEMLEKGQQTQHTQKTYRRLDETWPQALSPAVYPAMKTSIELHSSSVTAPPATIQPVKEKTDIFIFQRGSPDTSI
jgi:hypothetical protein